MTTICNPCRRIPRPVPNYRILTLIALAGVVFGACQRPFEESPRPRIDVIQPDITVIQTERQPQLAIRVTSSTDVDLVLAGSDTLAYDEANNVWRGQHLLTNGLNQIVFSITDGDMRTTRDTAYALVHVLQVSSITPNLPGPRGGHTATLLENGAIVLIGGAPHATGPALDTGLMLPKGSSEFVELDDNLNVPRTGHTATLLPDGRILIIGGSKRDEIRMIEDVIETVEVFDPVTGTFEIVPVHGEPIRRADHTATLHEEDGELFVDLYGGTGDISYRPPILGTRADVRRFLIRGDSLSALDPAPGPMMNDMLAGHSQIELYPNVLGDRRFLVTGAHFGQGAEEGVNTEVEYDPRFGILQYAVAPLHQARTDHAAVLLRDGFVGLFGGRQESRSEALNTTEIYSSRARRSFQYSETGIALSRYGHTATKIENERIRIFGGFLSTGEGTLTNELYSPPIFEGGVHGKQ